MPEGEGEMRSRKQENRVEISDFVPDFNFDWSIFRKENIRLTTARRKSKACRQFFVYRMQIRAGVGRDD